MHIKRLILLVLISIIIQVIAIFPVYATAEVGNWVGDLAISPDSKKIAFSSDESIYYINIANRKTRYLTAKFDINNGLKWSPDSQKIAFVDRDIEDQGVLKVVSLDGSEPHTIFQHDDIIDVAWSSDSKILFAKISINEKINIKAFNISDGADKTSEIRSMKMPQWREPDIFEKDYESTEMSHIWKKDSKEKSGSIQLTFGPYHDRDPQLSPDKEWIVFESDRIIGVWKMRPDGSDMVHLAAAGSTNAAYPTWAPDGSFIAFVKAPLRVNIFNIWQDSYSDAEIWIIRPDGKGLKQLSRMSPFYKDGTISAAAWPWFRWFGITIIASMVMIVIYGIKCNRNKRKSL